MKTIFSTATLVALLGALASAAPTKLATRSVLTTFGADFYFVLDGANPNTLSGATSAGEIERINGNNEVDTLVSFTIPPYTSIPGASASSTCQLVIRNPSTVTGSGETQIFTLGGAISSANQYSFYQHPFYDQYRGVQQANLGTDSTPIDVQSFPCGFGGNLQLALRPQNDNDLIEFSQTSTTGLFIEDLS